MLSRVAGSVGPGLLGALLALGGAALFGIGDGGTTTVRVFDDSSAPGIAEFATGQSLAVRDIYRRSAPGVVQITSTTVEQTDDPFADIFGYPPQQTQSLGSGLVIDKNG